MSMSTGEKTNAQDYPKDSGPLLDSLFAVQPAFTGGSVIGRSSHFPGMVGFVPPVRFQLNLLQEQPREARCLASTSRAFAPAPLVVCKSPRVACIQLIALDSHKPVFWSLQVRGCNIRRRSFRASRWYIFTIKNAEAGLLAYRDSGFPRLSK